MSVEQNPACARLVKLFERVHMHGGMLRTTASRKERVYSKLCSVHRRFLEQQVVCQALVEALQAVSGQSEGEWLAWAEVQHCLGGATPGDSLLGVKPSHVRAVQTLSKGVLPELEQRLRSKCRMAVEWSEGHVATGSEELQLAKAGQLPQLVGQQLQELRATEERLHSRRHERANRVSTRHKVLLESCLELQQLLEQHKLAVQVDAESITVDYLHTQCRAMLGKMEVMQYQLLKGVCSDGRLQALKELRSHLLQACSSREKHLLQTRQALQHYQSFGASFARLAQEYQEVLAETENKQWALSELGKSDAP